MMNKKIRFLPIYLMFVFTIACNLSSSKDASFTGDWKLIKSNGIHFNVLPDVKLKEISRAKVRKSSKEFSNLPDDKVVFAYDSTNYFSETEFYYIVSYKGGRERLKLLSLDEKNWYLLGREALH